ncbi:MAG TPA: TolC family protein [Niabella sp.]|mgnify:CR=1 FL=1|nr:TolC family protein [Niabella sp.]HQX21675.1 TolC family protein [Niabella sp.]HRB27428.1 TolC family protein [Niabella sp.]HRB34495.1 TolC family protein [Niabella sp.]HRB44335.1 TolC family protein [Niabella sp.]
MKRILLSIVPFVSFTLTLCAQDKWDLKRCIDYAVANNISVKQADVQFRMDKLTHAQSVLAQYPRISSQHSGGFQFGRSIDPTSNQFTTNEIFFTNHGLDIGVDLFNWFSQKNTIAANKYLAQAGGAKLEKAKNDIALNVANAYLAALLNKEQINIATVQLGQSLDQVNNIKKQVDAGALPELNLAETQTQYANDSSNVITAKTNFTLSLLQLKALLNIDADQAFDIVTPPVESIPLEPLADQQPDLIYQSAVENLPQQKINTLNLKASEKNVAVAKAALYPTISFFGGLSSRYANAQKLIPNNYQAMPANIGTVNINGTSFPVTTIITQPTGFYKNTYFKQLNNNFSQNLGIGLSIPIFNGGMVRTNWQKAKLNLESQQLVKEQDSKTLKQDIYQAYTNALAAIEKFNASKITLASAQKAYDFARKRFDVGLLKPIDLITNQNNLFRAKINLVSAQYDYVFKMKLLEFYKGQGLRL